MPKSKLKESRSTPKPTAEPSPTSKEPAFPAISVKKGLSLTCVIPSQIYVLDGLLSGEECDKWVAFGKGLVMEGPKPPGRDEAVRTNYRFQTYAPTFASKLYKTLTPHLPHEIFGHHAALYPKIRIYEYPTGTFFGRHYDDSTTDPLTRLTSRWTLLIYLTGSPDVRGGSTTFWTREPNARGKGGESVRVECIAGRAVLHLHGDDCLIHEGEVVEKGEKWVLRSDLMYA